MMAVWLVLAVETVAQQYQRQLLIAGVTIAAVLLVAALILAWVRQLQKKKPPLQLNAGDQLAHFRVLYERGELSTEEFQRLRVLLTGRIREELAGGTAPAAPTATEVPAAPTNNGPAGQNGTPAGPPS